MEGYIKEQFENIAVDCNMCKRICVRVSYVLHISL